MKKIIAFGRSFVLYIAVMLKYVEEWLQEGKERNRKILDDIKKKKLKQ